VLGRRNIRPPHFASKVSYSASPQTFAECSRSASCCCAATAMLLGQTRAEFFLNFKHPTFQGAAFNVFCYFDAKQSNEYFQRQQGNSLLRRKTSYTVAPQSPIRQKGNSPFVSSNVKYLLIVRIIFANIK